MFNVLDPFRIPILLTLCYYTTLVFKYNHFKDLF